MKYPAIALCTVAFLWLTGCTSQETTHEAQIFTMDTFISLTFYGDQGEEGLSLAKETLYQLDGTLSRTNPDSQVALINQEAGLGATLVDGEVIELVTAAQTISEATQGSFDITICPVADAWGWTGESYQVPTQETIDALLPRVDYQAITLDPAASTLSLSEGMSIDLGGIAKGYAAQYLVTALTQADVTSGLINMGSTITAMGTKPDGSAFRLGIKDPQNTEEYLCVLELTDMTTSTSGAYERNFQVDGTFYHHILDPATGYPSQSDLLAVTVVSEDAPLTDALSTACFVLGVEGSLDLWRQNQLSDFELILITQDSVMVTAGLADSVTPYCEEAGYTYVVLEG